MVRWFIRSLSFPKWHEITGYTKEPWLQSHIFSTHSTFIISKHTLYFPWLIEHKPFSAFNYYLLPRFFCWAMNAWSNIRLFLHVNEPNWRRPSERKFHRFIWKIWLTTSACHYIQNKFAYIVSCPNRHEITPSHITIFKNSMFNVFACYSIFLLNKYEMAIAIIFIRIFPPYYHFTEIWNDIIERVGKQTLADATNEEITTNTRSYYFFRINQKDLDFECLCFLSRETSTLIRSYNKMT